MGCFSNMKVEEVARLFDNPSRLAMEHIPFSKQFHESDNASLKSQMKQKDQPNIDVLYRDDTVTINAIVVNLLERHFGLPQKTLVIDGKSQRSSRLFFYTLQDKAKVLSIRDALNENLSEEEINGFVEITRFYASQSRKPDLHANQCACFTESDGEWMVGFYIIEGIRYHKSLGKRIAASLILSKHPFVCLSSRDSDSFYGFWGRQFYSREEAKLQTGEGLSYWVNKNLYYNDGFRRFAVDFFSVIGIKSKNYILKDIGRTIQRHGFFLPPVSFEKITHYHTPKEYVLAIMPSAGLLGVNLNTLDLNMAFFICELLRVTSRQDWKYLKSLSHDVVSGLFSLNVLFEGAKAEDVVAAYYQHSLINELDSEEVGQYAKDYGRMCIELNRTVNLGYSYRGLIRAHNELSRTINHQALVQDLNTPLVTEPSRFDSLEEQLNNHFPREFERIKDARRLLEEGEDQHNCVFSRRQMIRNDYVSIFHWNYAGGSYTIQFGKDQFGLFRVDEIKGKYNVECSVAILRRLNDILLQIHE